MNDRTTPVQTVARLVGIVFLLVGIAGFIPGITTNLYDGLEFAGDNGNAELLGLFQVSVLHNIVHALFAIGILMAATPQGARTFLLGLHQAAASLVAAPPADLFRPLSAPLGESRDVALPGGLQRLAITGIDYPSDG